MIRLFVYETHYMHVARVCKTFMTIKICEWLIGIKYIYSGLLQQCNVVDYIVLTGLEMLVNILKSNVRSLGNLVH